MQTLPTLPVSERRMSPSARMQCFGILSGIATILLTLSPSNAPSFTFLIVTILYVPLSSKVELLKANPLCNSIMELTFFFSHPSGTPSTILVFSCPGKWRSPNHSFYRRCAASSSNFIGFSSFSIKESERERIAAMRCWMGREGIIISKFFIIRALRFG